MPHISVATWNINSVRIRTDHIARFASEHQPDVLCLQEIKCRNEEFPLKAFSAMGLRYNHVIGQKGSHGVAIVSKYPLQVVQAPSFCPRSEARVASVAVKGFTIHNLYVPAGGETPVPSSDKYQHKLELLQRMRDHYAAAPKDKPLMLVGDLNIAPGENDVWNHKLMLNEIGHTPAETESLEAVRAAGGFIDVARALKPDPEKLYSWWSYRGDWKTANRGRRLDHIWATPGLAERCDRIEFVNATRGWDRPSDHIPVVARFTI
ncbi:MAG: exodeoxyribonuclease III [Alphaproteobacteria bacterium]|nr:exodeoxyribonuclease III [Alphaproteobacteria bacterium]